jgi:hypothetical protein
MSRNMTVLEIIDGRAGHLYAFSGGRKSGEISGVPAAPQPGRGDLALGGVDIPFIPNFLNKQP